MHNILTEIAFDLIQAKWKKDQKLYISPYLYIINTIKSCFNDIFTMQITKLIH